jgi:hypothetical protein
MDRLIQSRAGNLMAALLLTAASCAPQDLAPGVVMLSRIKAHARDEAARLPNYTCLETITRFERTGGGKLNALDTVRLEIVYSDHREWYGAPGDRSLSQDDPASFVGSGLIGNGVFASTLHNILTAATFIYKGEQPINGRTGLQYDFLLPRGLNGLQISVVGGSGSVGERGSLWADPKTFELIRMENNADDIPGYLPLAAASTAVDYARTVISGQSVLLAQQAEMRLKETSGAEAYDRVDFTHCRAYSTESTIRFDVGESEPVAPAAARQSASPPESVPANLMAIVSLSTPINSNDAVGQLIEGKMVGSLTRKGVVVVPDGAAVHGRIRRLERYQGSDPDTFIVGLEFTEVETPGGLVPFYADLLRMDPVRGVKPLLSHTVVVHNIGSDLTTRETVTLPELPGVASFFVSGNAFTLAAGLRTVWRTRGPIRR